MVESVAISWKIGLFEDNDIFALKEKKKMHLLPNPWWGWCADPFLFEYEGDVYVFAEIWNYFKQRGAIGYYKVTGNDNSWHIVISERYHLSYPMIWKDEQGIHICAESCGCMDLHRYDCVDFPDRWKKERVYIREQKLADSTFLFNDSGNPVYCFTYEILGKNKGILKRYNFKDDYIDMKSETEITRNSKFSRPGGMFIRRDGKIYRVAQDCSNSYGEHLCFLKVENDNPYRESMTKMISYESFNVADCIGIHTYNKLGKYEVVDFRIRKFSIINFIGTYMRFAARGMKSALIRKKE